MPMAASFRTSTVILPDFLLPRLVRSAGWCSPKTRLRTSPSLLSQRWQRRYASNVRANPELEARVAAVPIERMRNFCVIAHIDHGKSTLSDRLLELTGTIQPGGSAQVLDKLDVERERGITVKAQTCTMLYNHKGEDYLLHLVDTPGHVDFRAEVARSYASCNGALLVVDASQGVQAQTVANFYLAFAQGLSMIPVINKVDLQHAEPQRAVEQLKSTFELEDPVLVSAKTGLNVGGILPAVIERVPPPEGSVDKPLRMLLLDSWYSTYKGVVLLVRVFDGVVKQGDQIMSVSSKLKYFVGELGIQYPTEVATSSLRAGQVGYMYFNPGMKNISDAKLGDTFCHVGKDVEPFRGFEEPQPMVFVGAFPTNQDEFQKLEDSINQLTLNDRSITLAKESSHALGLGWRLGFLGTLHCSVFEDRLRQEFGGSELLITAPTVPFKIVWRDVGKNKAGEDGPKETIITNPALYPEEDVVRTKVEEIQEPFVLATITVPAEPAEFLGHVIELCQENRGTQVELTWFATQVILKYKLPLLQLVDNFFGKLKGITKGYATLDYEDAGYMKSDIVKLELLVNKEPVDAIAQLCHRSSAERLGRMWVQRFKSFVDRQLFEIVVQAAIGKRVLARETVQAFRKDVTAKLYGGDHTRRKKLLEKQKAGKKKLRAIGNVIIDQKAFQGFLSKDSGESKPKKK
ncbi:Translation factor guf1 mitochondrial [Orbilia oligospora]|uniref:Translation factor guf1 mitochondrial n=3 Tax=Orbilia oligospora TaxID=2813651 RepID=A0A7C8QE29_ORBOL|nr:Translation factor guf1 mitochondrial [Orbilia oligospora]